MPSYNRETARDKLATLATAALVPGTLTAVIGYQPTNLNGQSPVLAVVSGGSARTRQHLGSNAHHLWVFFSLATYVLYAETSDGTWTRALAEDQLDSIEASIADLVIANKSVLGYWDELEYAAQSIVDQAVVGGVPYLREIQLLKARIIHG